MPAFGDVQNINESGAGIMKCRRKDLYRIKILRWKNKYILMCRKMKWFSVFCAACEFSFKIGVVC